MEEIWRPIPEFEAYSISNTGKIKRYGKLRRINIDRDGYMWLTLSKKGKYVYCFLHRLICITFNSPPPFPEAKCLHRDDNKAHNTPDNLYWGTSANNTEDRRNNGKSFTGDNNPNYRHGGYCI